MDRNGVRRSQRRQEVKSGIVNKAQNQNAIFDFWFLCSLRRSQIQYNGQYFSSVRKHHPTAYNHSTSTSKKNEKIWNGNLGLWEEGVL